MIPGQPISHLASTITLRFVPPHPNLPLRAVPRRSPQRAPGR